MSIIERRTIQENYLRVEERIEQTAVSVGRDPTSVRLVVVTKGHPVEAVQAAVEAGARLLGENYAEEGAEKKAALVGHPDLEWHMIGHIQSRKAQLVAETYDAVHSLDRKKVAQRLDRFAGEQNRRLPVLLECNVSGEETKFGFSAWQEQRWSDLLDKFRAILELPNLDVRGLMTMAPFFDDPEPARPYFRKLRRLQEYLQKNLPEGAWTELSMGMSGDFTVAIEEGATLVRIGTAILGERPAQAEQYSIGEVG